MRVINLAELMHEVALRFQREQKGVPIPFFMTIPENLPSFPWIDDSVETLIFTLCSSAISKGYPGKPVRVAVSQKAGFSDLNELIKFRPLQWMQLKIDTQSPSELGDDVREKLKSLDYQCIDEWTNKGSTSRLSAYSRPNQDEPQFLFWIQSNKASRRYILLIPFDKS
jgi:hypothetical protein